MSPSARALSHVSVLALSAAGSLWGQDRRTVAEPTFPPVCALVEARLSAPGGALSLADEKTPDTRRIQEAIDQCTSGTAVKRGDRRRGTAPTAVSGHGGSSTEPSRASGSTTTIPRGNGPPGPLEAGHSRG